MNDRCFVAASDSTEISEVLLRYLGDCSWCLGKKTYFCLEKSCKNSKPFCLRCEGYMHTVHRINDAKYVFVDQNIVKPTHRQAISYLQDLIERMTYQKDKAVRAVDESIKIAQKLDTLVKYLQEKHDELLRNDPLSELYKMVEKTLLDNRRFLDRLDETFPDVKIEIDMDYPKKKEQFEKLFSSIDFSE